MITRSHTLGFTLIELLIVIAIISLLMAVLTPSLERAREQSRCATCLSNLRQIGVLLHTYANEDRANQPIPIHFMMVRRTGQHWLWRTARSFIWAGRDAQQPLLRDDPTYPGELWLSGGPHGYVPPGLSGPGYRADDRPLNRHYLGTGFTERERVQMPLFRCPADVGYPTDWHADDVPACAYDRPCHDVFGNSYRANTRAFIDDTGALSVSAWGHRLDALLDPAQLILAAEAPFFTLTGGPGPGRARKDWHARDYTANVLVVDGGVRAARTIENPPLDEESATAMDLLPGCNPGLISIGPGWRLDTWPTPGARIWGDESGWTYPFPAILDPLPLCKWKRDAWPFVGYERNLQ